MSINLQPTYSFLLFWPQVITICTRIQSKLHAITLLHMKKKVILKKIKGALPTSCLFLPECLPIWTLHLSNVKVNFKPIVMFGGFFQKSDYITPAHLFHSTFLDLVSDRGAQFSFPTSHAKGELLTSL